ncbi:hypothetical protein BEN30_00530 [Magnetovibrio blakemorei]|uniref:Outer membrane protein assembly factor BamE domain-containing protein n=2 Tax=Magnetovibrio blakemorei TaxID=28181 RepID=A0A1E5Q456_9PROT|nr:hypothetical protein BEN30_00530 [Magnetovibrio blakemorei]
MLGTVLIVLGLSTACAPRVNMHGNAVQLEEIAAIEPGVYTRDRVLDTLGSPSSTDPYDDSAWYYISERTETTAFFAPEVIERQVVAIIFDEHGVVKSVDVYDKNSAEYVNPVERKTPTAGNSLGVIEQMLSNLGRFNKK